MMPNYEENKKTKRNKNMKKFSVSQVYNPNFIPSLLEYIGVPPKRILHGYILTNCPFHPDENPSFSVIINKDGKNGRPYGFAKCFACGERARNVFDLIKKLKKQGYKLGPYDVKATSYKEKEFAFKDFDGQVRYYQEIVYDVEKGKKKCKYFVIKGKQKIYNIQHEKRIFYGLDTIKSHMTHLVVLESPQDVEALKIVNRTDVLGMVATAGSTTWHETYSDLLYEIKKKCKKLQNIIFVPQNDFAGRRWLRTVINKFKDIFGFNMLKICNICKDTQVKDLDEFLAPYIFDPEFEEKKDEYFKEIKELIQGSLNSATLLETIRLPQDLYFDEEDCDIKKVKKDGVVQVYTYIAYPEAICIDLVTGERQGLIVTKKTKYRTQTEYIQYQIPSEYAEKFQIPPDTARKMADLISHIVDLNDLPVKYVIGKLGWNSKGEKFISPQTIDEYDIMADDLFHILDEEYINKKITEEEAEATLRELLNKASADKGVIVPILFSILSLYYKNRGAVLEISGQSGTGKTFGTQLTMNLLGQDLNNWEGTKNYINAILTKFNCGVLALDEKHHASARTIIETYYMVTDGKIRGRLSKNSMLNKTRTKFAAGIISTGESSILDTMEYYKKSEINVSPLGALNRVIMLRLTQKQYVRGLREYVRKKFNCGIIDYRKDINKKSLKIKGWLYKLWLKYFPKKDSFSVEYGESSHVEAYLNTMQSIAVKMNEIGWINDESLLNITNIIIELKAQLEDNNDEKESEVDNSQLTEYLLSNLDKMIDINDKEFPERLTNEGLLGFYERVETSSIVNEAEFRVENGEVIKNEDENEKGEIKTFFLFPRKLKEICRKIGISYNTVKENNVTKIKRYISVFKQSRQLMSIPNVC